MVNPQQYYSPPPQTNGNLAYLPTAYPPQYYPSSPPTPQQDPLEQLAKTVRLLDYIKGREAPSSQPQAQPSQQQQVSQFGTPGAGSVAQFMPQAQADLDRQYQAMASTQASGISTQANSQPWQQVWGQTQASNNLEAQQQQTINKQLRCIYELATVVDRLDAEISQWVNLSGNLVHFMEINLMLNQEIEKLDQLVFSLLPFVTYAEVWKKDALEHEAVLKSVLSLLLDPGYLVYHAFEMWKNMQLTDFDLDCISQQFLQLMEAQKPTQPQQQVGQFLPSLPVQQPYFMPQQQASVPFPPVPGTSQAGVSGIYSIIEAIKNPQGADTAKALIRARNAGLI